MKEWIEIRGEIQRSGTLGMDPTILGDGLAFVRADLIAYVIAHPDDLGKSTIYLTNQTSLEVNEIATDIMQRLGHA